MTQTLPAKAPPDAPDYLAPEFNPQVHLAYHEKIKWERQERLLEGYAEAGTIKAGLKKSGVPRRTVEGWRRTDLLGFRRRFEEAHRAFCDEIEDKMWRLSSALKPGQNTIPLITLANANMPEKYRGNAPDPGAQEAREALVEIGRAMRARREALEAPQEQAQAPSLPSPPPSLPLPSQGQGQEQVPSPPPETPGTA